MNKPDLRRLKPSRLPAQLPINETAIAFLYIKAFPPDLLWIILTAIAMTAFWLIRISQMVVERWIDPFDFER